MSCFHAFHFIPERAKVLRMRYQVEHNLSHLHDAESARLVRDKERGTCGHRSSMDGDNRDEHLSFCDEFCILAVLLVGVVDDPLDHV